MDVWDDEHVVEAGSAVVHFIDCDVSSHSIVGGAVDALEVVLKGLNLAEVLLLRQLEREDVFLKFFRTRSKPCKW